MATIHIGEESEGANCWQYQVQVQTRRKCHQFVITLNWLDYDHWSHGREAPCVVVKAIMRFVLDQQPPEEISPKFDCAAVRRCYPELDSVLPTMF
ncbi:hypothetical protein JYU15_00500 [bacterium AH-315-I18]|nr:hypothetical protein [Phycisphaeraceae bacterium]MBN4060893.1 hypothetical protein [bacterium AH-315-I18]